MIEYLSIEEFDYFIFEEALFDKSYKELYNYFKVDFNLDDSFSAALTLKTFDLNKIEEEYKSKAEKVAKGIIK